MERKFYITTPIYYVNAEPHLGHAYTTIVADVMNRFYLLMGLETYFVTGTDEHGDKVARAASDAGEDIKQYVDMMSERFRGLWPKLNITNDYFIRTTYSHHIKTVQYILNRVNEKGDIYFSDYQGLYCYGCERFYTEKELIDGQCPDHRTEPVLINEANYFFRMSNYQDWLIDHIKKNPDFIRPERYRNEVLSFLKEPLEHLCISRPKKRLKWGVTLPFDENYVTYVWFDALINYVSALNYPDGDLFKKFWPWANHLIAKDILKPHGIYWPCMLKSAGIEPYRHLNVHGYWKVDQGKMSKSLGNVVRPLELVDIYGVDAFRYFLMREMVFGLDSDFSEEALVNRINSDLANDLGNLVSRSLTMVKKFQDGHVLEPELIVDEDKDIKDEVFGTIKDYCEFMEGLAFHKALKRVWELIGRLNKYIVTQEPWVLAKTNRPRLKSVLYFLTQSIKALSVMLWPFMPDTCEKIQGYLGMERRGKDFKIKALKIWEEKETKIAVSGPIQLFPRVDMKKFEKERRAEEKTKVPSEKVEEIGIQEFQKLDLRVGIIREAEKVKGSKKLIALKVELGDERTIVAGIGNSYTPEDLVGKRVVVVANLKPVKLMGIESQGMLLASEDKYGVKLIVPDGEVQPGSKVK